MKFQRATSYKLSFILACLVAMVALPLLAQPEPDPGIGGGGPGGPGGPGGGPGEGRRGAMLAHRMQGGPAQAGQFGHMTAQWLVKPEISQELNLTPEQVKKLEQIDLEAEKASIEVDAKLKQSRLEMQQAMREDKPDRGAIMKQVEAAGQLLTEKQKLEVGRMLDIKAVLTPEQAQKARQLGAERMKQARERMGGPEGREGRRGEAMKKMRERRAKNRPKAAAPAEQPAAPAPSPAAQ